MSAVELQNLTLTRGRRTVLSNVSASIGDGEFIGVFGPNGAGKTTLLHAILGLLPPAAGAIRVFGNSPRNGFYGPGLLNFDTTISKRFPIGEHVGLSYRAEFFNIANHPNFSLVANNVNMSSGSFGQMSASSPYIFGAARVIQMTLRLEF